MPFADSIGPGLYINDGADLVLYEDGSAEMSLYSRSGIGDDINDPTMYLADTVRVAGTYRRDDYGTILTFDSGYLRMVRFQGEYDVEDRLFINDDPSPGGPMEFVPVDRRRDVAPIVFCDA